VRGGEHASALILTSIFIIFLMLTFSQSPAAVDQHLSSQAEVYQENYAELLESGYVALEKMESFGEFATLGFLKKLINRRLVKAGTDILISEEGAGYYATVIQGDKVQWFLSKQARRDLIHDLQKLENLPLSEPGDITIEKFQRSLGPYQPSEYEILDTIRSIELANIDLGIIAQPKQTRDNPQYVTEYLTPRGAALVLVALVNRNEIPSYIDITTEITTWEQYEVAKRDILRGKWHTDQLATLEEVSDNVGIEPGFVAHIKDRGWNALTYPLEQDHAEATKVKYLVGPYLRRYIEDYLSTQELPPRDWYSNSDVDLKMSVIIDGIKQLRGVGELSMTTTLYSDRPVAFYHPIIIALYKKLKRDNNYKTWRQSEWQTQLDKLKQDYDTDPSQFATPVRSPDVVQLRREEIIKLGQHLEQDARQDAMQKVFNPGGDAKMLKDAQVFRVLYPEVVKPDTKLEELKSVMERFDYLPRIVGERHNDPRKNSEASTWNKSITKQYVLSLAQLLHLSLYTNGGIKGGALRYDKDKGTVTEWRLEKNVARMLVEQLLKAYGDKLLQLGVALPDLESFECLGYSQGKYNNTEGSQNTITLMFSFKDQGTIRKDCCLSMYTSNR
jgi:hypothetical protein